MYYTEDKLPAGVSHPSKHLEKLLRLPEFAHLRDGEANIRFLFRQDVKIQQGRQILGTCHIPSVQGRLKDVFLWLLEEKFGALPDFLIELESEYWVDECDDLGREILIYHELMHAGQARDKDGEDRFDQEGRPVWCIIGHDVEEFAAVVRRYGLHDVGLKQLMQAAREHEAENS